VLGGDDFLMCLSAQATDVANPSSIRHYNENDPGISLQGDSQQSVFPLVENPENDSWYVRNPSTRPLRRRLRANGHFTNWVSTSKTVRAEPLKAWAVFHHSNCRF